MKCPICQADFDLPYVKITPKSLYDEGEVIHFYCPYCGADISKEEELIEKFL